MTFFDFEGDGIGDAGAGALARGLIKHARALAAPGTAPRQTQQLQARSEVGRLISVNLDDNGVTEAGALELADAAEAHPLVGHVSLRFNPIFCETAAASKQGGKPQSESAALGRIEEATRRNRERRAP